MLNHWNSVESSSPPLGVPVYVWNGMPFIAYLDETGEWHDAYDHCTVRLVEHWSYIFAPSAGKNPNSTDFYIGHSHKYNSGINLFEKLPQSAD